MTPSEFLRGIAENELRRGTHLASVCWNTALRVRSFNPQVSNDLFTAADEARSEARNFAAAVEEYNAAAVAFLPVVQDLYLDGRIAREAFETFRASIRGRS